jgi:hypothetical protein
MTWESARPLFGSGFTFVAAARTGAGEVGTSVLTAASALEEKGHKEKALAAVGRSMLNATIANPDIRNCWLNFIGEQGMKVVLPNTKMA